MSRKFYLLISLLLLLCLAIGAFIFLLTKMLKKQPVSSKQTIHTEASTPATAKENIPFLNEKAPDQSPAEIVPSNAPQISQSQTQTADQWRRSLPLYKDNLTFLGANGKAIVLEHAASPCREFKPVNIPTHQQIKWNELECELYTYSDGTRSIFYFDNDLLRARAELDYNYHRTAFHLFFPPPAYEQKDEPNAQLQARGLLLQEQLYRGAPGTAPFKVRSFGPDAFIILESTIHPQTKQLDIFHYQSNHQFIAYTRGIFPSQETFYLRLFGPSIDGSSVNRYTISSTDPNKKTKTGSWKLEKQTNTVVLDDGRRFPPADTRPRAPTYCEIYPNGCYQFSGTQENEIAIIN